MARLLLRRVNRAVSLEQPVWSSLASEATLRAASGVALARASMR